MATIVEMRYFGGITETEIAEAVGVHERTVRRDWEKARLFLREALDPQPGPGLPRGRIRAASAMIYGESWTRLNQLLDEALDLPPADRERWLARLGPEKEALKDRLSALLAHASSVQASSFLTGYESVSLAFSEFATMPPSRSRVRRGPARRNHRPVPSAAKHRRGRHGRRLAR